MLAEINRHERDCLVKFKEEGHVYRVEGFDDQFISVTQYIKSKIDSVFNSEAMVRCMMKSKGFDEGHKYFGKSESEILESWALIGKSSSDAGRCLHKFIEDFFNDAGNDSYVERVERMIYSDTDSWEKFKEFIYTVGDKFVPYRTEWVIYSEKDKLAGTIDLVTRREDGSVELFDWKRVKHIARKRGTNISSHVQYNLQLNLYKYIIEKNYGLIVSGMYLVQIHPDKRMSIVEVPDESDMVEGLKTMSYEEYRDRKTRWKRASTAYGWGKSS